MYKEARKQAGLSIEEASFGLHIAPRTLCKYESGETVPPPEVVLEMNRLYRAPWLTQHYCREHCAIGRAYGYEVLTGVNLDPASVMLKLVSEMAEAQAVLQKMLELTVNKNRREDFTPEEWAEFTRCLQEFLDVEHNVETLKISLGCWCDVAELVAAHNKKCRERGYTKEKAAC
ncbi:MAG: helix-turn-helix domain-containing protein [Desulfotomaculales bacterium]